MVIVLTKQNGQTTIEYLLLMFTAFLVAYIVIRGPIATFAEGMILRLRGGLGNTVRNAEWANSEVETGQSGHPADPSRFKPLH